MDQNELREPEEQREERVDLPFETGRRDWSGWVYDHRAGILVTVIAYLLLAIFIVTARIIIHPTENRAGFFVDLQDIEALAEERDRLEEEVRQMQSLNQLEREYYESIRNLASNEQGQLNSGASGTQGGQSQVFNDARALEERMRADRENYERGLQDADNILSNRPAATGDSPSNETARIEGTVSISYSLSGRQAVYLYRPTYLCQGGGDVVVNIVVDRNGRVINATVNAASVDDTCLKEYAVKAALESRFNTDGTAETRQPGTITYRFASQ